MEERIQKLEALQEQMKALRKDESLITGITFNTLAGDVKITKKEAALWLLDSMIKYLREEIKYCEK